ncbi:MAG TPA: zinc-dependent metalloprotease [Bdellovibrionales bacterium]|nr:zinc-dependent metalloprotease [Bdellovibrionales bacterium]
MKHPKVLLALILGLAITGCTKESPYVYETKLRVEDKAVIDTKAQYLYVASYGESTRTSTAARPFWMSSEKLVKFKWAEHALQVVEVERDPRFKDNPTNEKVVFEIPVEHLDYECASDRFGECTNKEQSNEKIEWDKKSKFRADYSAIKFVQVPILPVEIDNYIFMGGCYKESGTQFLGYQLKADSLDVSVEKSFTASLPCLDDSAESLSDATFSSVYHHSLVKVSSLASPNYKPIVYPQKDENDFGFFTTEVKSLDVDNRDVVDGKITYMNRWSPDRGTIVYHLSDSFKKYPKLMQATKKAVASINQALAKATPHKPLKIDLRDPSGKNPGDLRNNMIVLVDDPLAARVIGYGPSAANPDTGEIVSARTVMYLGTIKTTIRSTYNEFVENMRAQADTKPQQSQEIKFNIAGVSQDETNAVPVALLNPIRSEKGTVKARLPAVSRSKDFVKPVNIDKLAKEIHAYHKNTADSSRLQDRLNAMSEHCYYPAELFNFGDAIKYGLGELKDLLEGPLKPWDELTDSEKEKVLEILVPYVWVPTLVHELGHNLGLRHNFAGSEDKGNFYTIEELNEMGIKQPIKFASVMDYPYSSLNELPTMGKYDIAALRFALSREVELSDGTIKQVPHTLQDLKKSLNGGKPEEQEGQVTVKPYEFCTDEHVDANPGCKRFDEGTTLGEIATHFARTYESDYRRRYMRNNLRNYSLFGEGGHLARVDMNLRSLRLMFELYERLNNEFNIPPELWETNEFLKDIRKGVDAAAQTYLNILRTPDVTCAISTKANPTQILAAVPVSQIDPRAADCFEMEGLRPEFMVAGQAGKPFQSKKSKLSENPYADQIDIRGIWVDKMLALRYLFKRELGSSIFDRYTENFLNDSKTMPQTMATILQLFADDITAPVTFRSQDGKTFTGRVRYSLSDTHIINRPLDLGIAKYLEIGNNNLNPREREYEVPFVKEMVRSLRRNIKSTLHEAQAREVLELFEVGAIVKETDLPSNVNHIRVGTTIYYAFGENAVANMSINALKTIRDLKQVPNEKLQVIVKALKADPNAQAPAEATDAEKKAYTYKVQVLEGYLSGALKDEPYHSRLLNILASNLP